MTSFHKSSPESITRSLNFHQTWKCLWNPWFLGLFFFVFQLNYEPWFSSRGDNSKTMKINRKLLNIFFFKLLSHWPIKDPWVNGISFLKWQVMPFSKKRKIWNHWHLFRKNSFPVPLSQLQPVQTTLGWIF